MFFKTNESRGNLSNRVLETRTIRHIWIQFMVREISKTGTQTQYCAIENNLTKTRFHMYFKIISKNVLGIWLSGPAGPLPTWMKRIQQNNQQGSLTQYSGKCWTQGHLQRRLSYHTASICFPTGALPYARIPKKSMGGM